MESTGTVFVTTGVVRKVCLENSLPALQEVLTFTRTMTAVRPPVLISSLHTMVLPCTTWSAIMANTMRQMVKIIRTVRITTAPAITVRKEKLTTLGSTTFGRVKKGICWPLCFYPRVYQCWSQVMNLAEPNVEITMPTARTTNFPG